MSDGRIERSPGPAGPPALPAGGDTQATTAEDRGTRKPLAWWDRVKFLILFGVAWLVLAWSTYAEFQPLITVGEAFRQTLSSGLWVLILFGLEAVRQLHFFISERSAAYNTFWTERVWGRLNVRIQRMNPWNRYRVARALKWAFVIVIADLVVAALS